MLTRHQAAEMLASFDRVLILCHRNPDGDTLGSGFALCRAFLNQGKKARVFCNDPIPEKFSYMIPEQQEDFVPLHVVSVDVADPALLGPNTEQMIAPYSPIELSVDHHPTHKQFAQELFLEADSASCCEIVRELLREMGWEIDAGIANCLYTGLSTDTGCFKFSNTTPRTHRIAAEMIEMGADHTRINKVMFDTVTFNELELEQLALEKCGCRMTRKSLSSPLQPICSVRQAFQRLSSTELPPLPVKSAGLRLESPSNSVVKWIIRFRSARQKQYPLLKSVSISAAADMRARLDASLI